MLFADPGTLSVSPWQISTLFDHPLTIPNSLKSPPARCAVQPQRFGRDRGEFAVLAKKLRGISAGALSLIECCTQIPNKYLTPGGITQSQPAQGQSQTSKYQLTSEGSQNRWTQAMLNTAMNQFIASGPGSQFTQSQDQCVADYLQTTVTIQPNGFVHPDGTLTDAIATQAYNSCVNG